MYAIKNPKSTLTRKNVRFSSDTYIPQSVNQNERSSAPSHWSHSHSFNWIIIELITKSYIRRKSTLTTFNLCDELLWYKRNRRRWRKRSGYAVAVVFLWLFRVVLLWGWIVKGGCFNRRLRVFVKSRYLVYSFICGWILSL